MNKVKDYLNELGLNLSNIHSKAVKDLEGKIRTYIRRNVFVQSNFILFLLDTISKWFSEEWGNSIDFIDENSYLYDFSYDLINKAYKAEIKNESLLELSLKVLENNNIMFHKNADYTKYQTTSQIIIETIDKIGLQVDNLLHAKCLLTCVYSDMVLNFNFSNVDFEQALLLSLDCIEAQKEMYNTLFIGYINVSQFYLYKGYSNRTEVFLEKAKKILEKVTVENYRALFWYHLTWLYVEKGDYLKAKENIEEFFNTINKIEISKGIYLHALNIRASIELRFEEYGLAYMHATECLKLALEFYSSESHDVIAECFITLGKYYSYKMDYDKAEAMVIRGLDALEDIFGGNNIDPSQAAAKISLVSICVATGRSDEAYNLLIEVDKYYKRVYKDKFFAMYEVSILLKNFVLLYLKKADINKAKSYLKILEESFGLENKNTIEAFKAIEDAYRI